MTRQIDRTIRRGATRPCPSVNRLWPLYGAGFENLGRDGQPIERAHARPWARMSCWCATTPAGSASPTSRSSGLGEEHPRIYRDMQADPVVLGHEVSMTVVGVGENLRDQYQVGDRFIIQADIFVDGVSYAYGYEIQGGLSAVRRHRPARPQRRRRQLSASPSSRRPATPRAR